MLRFLVLAAFFGLGGLWGISAFERAMLYPFDSTQVAPERVGADRLSETPFETNGETLITWIALPHAGQPVIVYFHGNAGNLALRAGRFNRLLDRGYGLVALAYRGSSGSTGTPSQKALTEDARALWAALDDLTGPAPRVLYGESLGTGVAIVGVAASALADPVKGTAPAAIVLEAPFTSMPDIAAAMNPAFARLAPLTQDRWDSAKWAHLLHAPLLVIHGTEDELIPITQGRQIFEAANSAEKELLAVKGAGHSDLWRTDTLPRLWHFIEAHTDSRR